MAWIFNFSYLRGAVLWDDEHGKQNDFVVVKVVWVKHNSQWKIIHENYASKLPLASNT